MLKSLLDRFRNTRIDYVCSDCARAFDLPYDACPICEEGDLHRVVN
ncbi:hypothetical protein [Halomicrococcus sp. NG-SE-24]